MKKNKIGRISKSRFLKSSVIASIYTSIFMGLISIFYFYFGKGIGWDAILIVPLVTFVLSGMPVSLSAIITENDYQKQYKVTLCLLILFLLELSALDFVVFSGEIDQFPSIHSTPLVGYNVLFDRSASGIITLLVWIAFLLLIQNKLSKGVRNV